MFLHIRSGPAGLNASLAFSRYITDWHDLPEKENGNTPAQREELDWLLYHKPLEYAQMVLSGKIEHYLSLGCDHGRPKD